MRCGLCPRMRFHPLFLTAPILTACVSPPPELGEDTQEIYGDNVQAASQFQLDRAISFPGCTATKISARFALTAAHCQASTSQLVQFYATGPGVNTQSAANIVSVVLRPGVNGAACFADVENCVDTSGKFADIALLELATPITGQGAESDLEGHQATLAWTYPGYGYNGKKVGAGNHDGASNPNNLLLQTPDETTSDDDVEGRFDTREATTDQGDSGGPFYYGSRVLGTLVGTQFEGLNSYNVYTSVPQHLNWILTKIGYQWRGLPPQSSTLYAGTDVQSFVGSELECQYACEKTSSCEAYNFNTLAPAGTANCHLENNITSVSTASGWRGALKHGARQSNANDVVGFVRSDKVNSVIHKATNGNLHELALSGSTWSVTDIDPSATVASKLTAYRRAGNVDAIVFRSSANHIIQLLRTSSGWNDEANLTTIAGAELAAGTPTAYVRADGVSAVVYRGATTGHIIELRRGSRGFIATDLTAEAGSSVVASSDPMANARSDGYSSVVFRSTNGNLYELYKAAGGTWRIGAPAFLAGAPEPIDRPFAYTKRDGTNAIIYRQSSGQIVELQLVGSQWSWEHISSNAVGQPVAYVRADAVDAVMFRNTSDELIQVTAATSNLTTLTGAPKTVTSPAVFVRSDGYNSVLFETAANHVGELYYKRGGTWHDGDITAAAGETP